MIRGLHGLLYSSDADAARAYLRDKVKLPASDVGGGWLIFDLPEGDLGVHPLDEAGQPKAGTHDVSFYCDDIEGTVAEMRGRGVEFVGGIEDHGYGLVTHFVIPGGVKVQLYEPRYTKRRAAGGSGKPAGRAAAPRARAARGRSRTRASARKPAAKGRRPRR
jgi:hypothetical protein